MRNTAVPLVLIIAAMATPLSAQGPAAGEELPAPDRDLTAAEKVQGLSQIWAEAKYNFAFFHQVPDLDWDSAYSAFLPRVLETPSTVAYYRELQRFVALLEDGHTGVTLPRWYYEESVESYPWVLPQAVGRRALVRNVGRSLAEEIPVGSEIVAVDGRSLEAYLREHTFPYIAHGADHIRWDRGIYALLRGEPDTPVRLAWVTPDGERRERTLYRDRRSRDDAWVEENPARPDPFELRWMEGEIAYVALNTFADPAVADSFEAALPALARARGLIVDIRENGGGSSGIGWRVAGHLTDRPLESARWSTREHRAAHRVWGQHGDRYREYAELDAWFDGGTQTIEPADTRLLVPTVVLQGHGTASAAEDFLVALEGVPHVTTVGQLTFGSTGQPYSFPLPGGGSARICTKKDTYPDGREFVGYGIQPDAAVPLTIDHARAGRDATLERGLELLRKR